MDRSSAQGKKIQDLSSILLMYVFTKAGLFLKFHKYVCKRMSSTENAFTITDRVLKYMRSEPETNIILK